MSPAWFPIWQLVAVVQSFLLGSTDSASLDHPEAAMKNQHRSLSAVIVHSWCVLSTAANLNNWP